MADVSHRIRAARNRVVDVKGRSAQKASVFAMCS